MINELIARLLANLIYRIDRVCRSNLNSGSITTERDYVSNLGTHLRYPLGPFFEWNLALARTLEGNLEQTFGCDSILIFRLNDQVKIGLFEAKWPRVFKDQNYKWDKPNKVGNSRFSSQIIRQQNWISSGFVIWEIFFNESAVGASNPPWDDLGSTCVLHSDAANYFHTVKNGNPTLLWDNSDLNQLFHSPLNINQIAYRILSCTYGKVFNINDYMITITDSIGESVTEIPIPRRREIIENNNDRIYSFMEDNNISNYIFLDMIEFDQ